MSLQNNLNKYQKQVAKSKNNMEKAKPLKSQKQLLQLDPTERLMMQKLEKFG